jgi:hypothetical protein
MKIFFPLFLALIVGCRPQYIPFHSTIRNERISRSTATDMKLIFADRTNPFKSGIAVITAVDSEEGQAMPYIILAPSENGYAALKIEDVFLGHGVSVPTKQVKSLIAGLDRMAAQGNNPTADSIAAFYEFKTQTEMYFPSNQTTIATRDAIVQSQGPKEQGWVPSIDLTFNRTSRGSIGTLLIGDVDSKERYEIRDSETATGFKGVLIAALNDLQQRGYNVK